MLPNKLIFLIIMGFGAGAGILTIALTFYIGRTHIKEIDRIVFGYEFPNDSIFALMLRVANYGGAFLWKWSAKRSGLEGKIEHFDIKFKWPFIAVLLFAMFSIILLIVGMLFEKYVGL